MLLRTFPTPPPTPEPPGTIINVHSSIPPPFQLRYGFSERVLDKQRQLPPMRYSAKSTPEYDSAFTQRFPMKVDNEYYKTLEILWSFNPKCSNVAVMSDGDSGVIPALLDYTRHTTQPRILEVGGMSAGILEVEEQDKFDMIIGIRMPSEIEQNLSKCILSEVKFALKTLNVKGTFILKVTSTYTQASHDILDILIKSFGMVVMAKPATSCAGSHEKYIVCFDFYGPSYSVIQDTGTGDYIKSASTAANVTSAQASELFDINRVFSKAMYKALCYAQPVDTDRLYNLFDKYICI